MFVYPHFQFISAQVQAHCPGHTPQLFGLSVQDSELAGFVTCQMPVREKMVQWPYTYLWILSNLALDWSRYRDGNPVPTSPLTDAHRGWFKQCIGSTAYYYVVNTHYGRQSVSRYEPSYYQSIHQPKQRFDPPYFHLLCFHFHQHRCDTVKESRYLGANLAS